MKKRKTPKGITSLIYYVCPTCRKASEERKCPKCHVLGLSRRS